MGSVGLLIKQQSGAAPFAKVANNAKFAGQHTFIFLTTVLKAI